MAKECPICKKGSQMGVKRVLLRGKYNPTKKVRKYPNLQWATLTAASGPSGSTARRGGRIKICTDCLKKEKYLSYKK